MKAEVFKAYDIRGRLDDYEITPLLMQQVAQAFASKEESGAIIVGRDVRLSSAELASHFIEGLILGDKKVFDLGLTTTDLLYYASVKKDLPAAMITASHNPPNYNGVKLCHRQARALTATEIQDLKINLEPARPFESYLGNVQALDLEETYIEHLLQTLIEVEKIKPLKVGVDGGNGMVGILLEKLFQNLPCQIKGLYLEPDGNFPNHPADPSKAENLKDLQKLVKENGLDLGIAFDGDADRAVFVDNEGEIVNGNKALILTSQWLLQRAEAGNKRLVHDSISSQTVVEAIRKAGGVPIKSRVGTPFVKQMMQEHAAIFGGETSGHFYFQENFKIDSGLFTTLVMLQIISESQKSLATLQQEIRLYPHSGEIIFPAEDDFEEIVKRTTAYFEATDTAAEINNFDGLEIRWENVWFNLRASNTEPIIRLNVEGRSWSAVNDLSQDLQRLLATPSAQGT